MTNTHALSDKLIGTSCFILASPFILFPWLLETGFTDSAPTLRKHYGDSLRYFKDRAKEERLGRQSVEEAEGHRRYYNRAGL